MKEPVSPFEWNDQILRIVLLVRLEFKFQAFSYIIVRANFAPVAVRLQPHRRAAIVYI